MLSNNAHFRGSKEQAMRGGRDPVDAQSENKTKAGAGNHMTLVRMLPVLLIACFASFLLGMLWTDRGTVASIELQAQPLQILESGQSRHEEQAGNLSLPKASPPDRAEEQEPRRFVLGNMSWISARDVCRQHGAVLCESRSLCDQSGRSFCQQQHCNSTELEDMKMRFIPIENYYTHPRQAWMRSGDCRVTHHRIGGSKAMLAAVACCDRQTGTRIADLTKSNGTSPTDNATDTQPRQRFVARSRSGYPKRGVFDRGFSRWPRPGGRGRDSQVPPEEPSKGDAPGPRGFDGASLSQRRFPFQGGGRFRGRGKQPRNRSSRTPDELWGWLPDFRRFRGMRGTTKGKPDWNSGKEMGESWHERLLVDPRSIVIYERGRTRTVWTGEKSPLDEPCNVLFIKVHKCASTSSSSVARQIAHRRGNHGSYDKWLHTTTWFRPEPSVTADHGSLQIGKWNDLKKLNKRSILWATIRHPVSRCLSHFYYLLSSEHRMTSRRNGISPKSTPREAPGEEKVGYMQNNCHNFAWESIRTGDDDTPHSLVWGVYTFIAISERMDESMVMLAYLLRIPLSEVLYIKAKDSNELDGMARHKKMEQEDDVVQRFAIGESFNFSNSLDIQLYKEANDALDWRWKQNQVYLDDQLRIYRGMLASAREECWEERMKAFVPGHGNWCLHMDAGCGYKCLNEEFVSKDGMSSSKGPKKQ